MTNYADLISSAKVPQTEPLDERQVKNNAGGFVFAIDKWARLDRFLILGSDSPTYYQGARDLTKENANSVRECYAEDAERTVARIVEISQDGRAPKNDPAIFALALGAAHSDAKIRQSAIAAVPAVCRTGTHVFTFVEIARALGRGWGRSLKRAVQKWYGGKDAAGVGYQAIKYRSRGQYTHKRLLQSAHPAANGDETRLAIYRWIRGLEVDTQKLPPQVRAHIEAMDPLTPKGRVLDLVLEHRLPWEAIPTEYLKDADFWKATLPDVGMTALIRNLGTLAELGVTKPLSDELALVVSKLGDEAEIKKARVHPLAILQALAVYRGGKAIKGSRSWTPQSDVVNALDGAFYKAFRHVEPSNKRTLLAIDCSDSMTWNNVAGMNILPREAAAAMALVTDAVEPRTHIVGFSSPGIAPLQISSKMRLDAAIREIGRQQAMGTDCSLPMLYALEKGLTVDTFVVYTDNETYAGRMHPSEALKQYRKKTGINAKLIVVGMTSTGFSIADPSDAGMLDVVGFDSSAPAIMAEFAR